MKKNNSIFSVAKKISSFSFVIFLLLSAAVHGQTATITSSKNPSCEGTAVTFTVTVTPNPGAGRAVELFDNLLPIGSGVTDMNGVFTVTPPIPSAGIHTITGNYQGAPIAPLLQTVNAAPAVPAISGGPFARCGPGTVPISANAGLLEVVDWYADATGGTVLPGGSGTNNFTTPSITTTTTFYAEARSTLTTCVSLTRTPILVTVNAPPNVPTAGAGPFTRCGPGTLPLTATVGTGETIDWYGTATGGSVLAGGNGVTSFTTPSISSTTTYYAEARNTTTGCVSATRTAITATVNTPPAVPTAGTGPFTRCGPGTVILTATVGTGETIDWYSAATGGTVLAGGNGVTSFTTPSIATTTTYYAETRNTASGCVSATRTAITATVTAPPAAPSAGAGPFTRCGPGTVTLTATVGTGETIDWYSAATGGTVLAGGNGVTSFTTPSIAATTTYYAETRNTTSGCVSATRTAITATVTAPPAAPVAGAGPFTRCGPGTVTLTATVGTAETHPEVVFLVSA